MLKRIARTLLLLTIFVYSNVQAVEVIENFSTDKIQRELEATQLRFFLDQANPVTGLVRDQANNFAPTPDTNRMASMASTGFGLAVLANAALRNMYDTAQAKAYVLKVLKFSRDHVARRAGWFLHFMDWETGVRFGNSEYSTIDTALFMAGALYAAQVLNDPEITQITQQIYSEIDFQDALTDGGAKPHKKTLSMAYFPGQGYTPTQWDMYAEERLLLLLGLGHPTHPMAPELWLAFERPKHRLPNGKRIMGYNEALFTHQYSDLFVDFRHFDDGYPNYFANGVSATQYHRQLARHDKRYKALREGFWGFSAGAGPNGEYDTWGPTHHIGMVCMGCTMGSAMFMPQVVLADAATWAHGPYRKQIWGLYGFTDSLDLDQNWFSDHVYGITTGPIFLSLANIRPETSIWKDFMRIPAIQNALARAEAAGALKVSEAE